MLKICSAFIVLGHRPELAFELSFVYLILVHILEAISRFLKRCDIFHVKIAHLLELLSVLLSVLFL